MPGPPALSTLESTSVFARISDALSPVLSPIAEVAPGVGILIGAGELFYDFGQSMGWWGGSPFHGSVVASQSGKSVPSMESVSAPGPPNTAPSNGTNLGKILKCASKTANQFSIAGIMGITESNSVGATIGTAFLGNTFSGIVDTGTHIVTGHFGAAYGDVALGGYAQGLALGPNAPVAAQGVVGVVTNAGVDAALGEGMAGPVGWAKLGIDAATFLGSALYCASN